MPVLAEIRRGAGWLRPNIPAEGQTHTTAIRPAHPWRPKRGTLLRLPGVGRPDLVLPRSRGGLCVHASSGMSGTTHILELLLLFSVRGRRTEN